MMRRGWNTVVLWFAKSRFLTAPAARFGMTLAYALGRFSRRSFAALKNGFAQDDSSPVKNGERAKLFGQERKASDVPGEMVHGFVCGQDYRAAGGEGQAD